MPTKIEINKIFTPSNFDFYKMLTPGLYFNCTILTPDIMNKVLQLTVEHYLTFAGQNHTQYSLHSSIVKIHCDSFNLARTSGSCQKVKTLSQICLRPYLA